MSYEAWGEPDRRPYPTPAQRRVRNLPACMGGFCGVRSSCARYHQERQRTSPAERLCGPHDHDIWQPIAITRNEAAEHHVLALIHGKAGELDVYAPARTTP